MPGISIEFSSSKDDADHNDNDDDYDDDNKESCVYKGTNLMK